MLFFISIHSNAQVLICGFKKVTIQGDIINKIEHEDGTVHAGTSVSSNWKYDGVSIKHRLSDDPIFCDNRTKGRDETIEELSGRFVKNSNLYGMDKKEAELMRAYTANLMKNDNSCYLLVYAAKDPLTKGMYYIDCNDKSSQSKRYVISEKELKEGIVKNSLTPISESVAKERCNNELKKRTNNPSTYDPALTLGATSRSIESTGRNIVEIKFKASNSFGVEGKYLGRCIFESGVPIEVTINNI